MSTSIPPGRVGGPWRARGCGTLALVAVLAGGSTAAPVPDLQAHRAGMWEIAAPRGESRWIVIHGLDDAGRTGVYHVEVLSRRAGAPAWDVQRVRRHMAVTKAALERSVVRPLTRGAVYPEPFDSAYAAWRAENAGEGGAVCATSVAECLAPASGGR